MYQQLSFSQRIPYCGSGVLRNEQCEVFCGTEAEIRGLICVFLWLRVSSPSAGRTGTFKWRIICLPLCFPHSICSKLPFLLAEEESEAEDSAAVERAAIGKWIDAMGKRVDLKNKDTGIQPDKSVVRTPAGECGNFSRGYDCFFWEGM